ncbi:hypothetical protein R5R35_002683 [Gryllus longicercus]|uniref:General transcription factor 3C polypeptide 5 n=1 Tax=Gryllus longicercus TaxID=2509291 RepID=A0AAN9WJW1_9ORTH|nr:General transcription factor 3C polypeptide 5 [Gryllus bimaculatus]
MEDTSGFQRNLVCIQYPGIVVNESNMLRTLGGIQNISTAYCEKNRRLELRFRPDDVYCKPTCGEKHNKLSLLVKVKIRRKKHSSISSEPTTSSSASDIISAELSVLGKVTTTFTFKNLCDFQYLPIGRDASGTMQNIYDSLVPNGIPSSDWLKQRAMLFLPPAVFSRMDSMQMYLYRKEATDQAKSTPANIIGRTRRRRSGHAIFVTYDIPKSPAKPREVALRYLRLKFLSEAHLKKIEKLFSMRPIWSKNALMFHTKYTSDQLKFLLPAVAYYFVTGPWRIMWVRFGYDPRKDPSSRKYQTLDYRLRISGGLKTKVKAKRSYCNYLLPYKSSPSCRPKTAVITKELVQNKNVKKKHSTDYKENMYVFRPGMVPPSRQMFYQYCDVYVPEIQEMIIKLPPPAPDAVCHEKHGWMPSGLDDQCREILNRLVTEVLRKEMTQDLQKT